MIDEKKESEVSKLKVEIEDYNKLIEPATRSLELSKGVLRNEGVQQPSKIILVARQNWRF